MQRKKLNRASPIEQDSLLDPAKLRDQLAKLSQKPMGCSVKADGRHCLNDMLMPFARKFKHGYTFKLHHGPTSPGLTLDMDKEITLYISVSACAAFEVETIDFTKEAFVWLGDEWNFGNFPQPLATPDSDFKHKVLLISLTFNEGEGAMFFVPRKNFRERYKRNTNGLEAPTNTKNSNQRLERISASYSDSLPPGVTPEIAGAKDRFQKSSKDVNDVILDHIQALGYGT